MKDFFSTVSFSQPSPDHHAIEMTGRGNNAGGLNLQEFFRDVEAIKKELREVEHLKQNLKSCHEQSKTLHHATAVKELRFTMEADVAIALKKAKLIKLQLEALQRSNANHRSLYGCGLGSSSDRTRKSVVVGLKQKFKDSLDGFNEIRREINSEYRETVQRRYFTVTGENPDENTLDLLISTGESESFLQKAIEKQGRGRIEDTISEIQERHDSMKELEKNLKELHEVFMDMAVLVQSQGEQLNDIESHVARANSLVRSGTQQLQTASKHHKESRKCAIQCIILFIFIGLALVWVKFELKLQRW